MKGWMYILECSDGSYYIGSTIDLKRRIFQHQNGEGAKHTKNRLPVKLVYFELFWRIDFAFYREKQVQGWNRKKKEALIFGKFKNLHELAMCRNATSHLGLGFAQPAEVNAVQPSMENNTHPRAENDVQPPVDLL